LLSSSALAADRLHKLPLAFPLLHTTQPSFLPVLDHHQMANEPSITRVITPLNMRDLMVPVLEQARAGNCDDDVIWLRDVRQKLPAEASSWASLDHRVQRQGSCCCSAHQGRPRSLSASLHEYRLLGLVRVTRQKVTYLFGTARSSLATSFLRLAKRVCNLEDIDDVTI